MVDNLRELDLEFVRIQKRQKATINGDIALIKTDSNIGVEVGNTGIVVNFRGNGDSYQINGDFAPGGKISPGHIGPMEAIKVLAFGVYKLRKYLLETNVLDREKINSLESKTNPVFSNFLIKLFAKGGHSDLIQKIDLDTLRIDLKAFLNLEENDKLLSSMNSFAQRAEGMEFEAMVDFAK
ncbi:hypothetical protein IT417_03195 [bacterium]|nr:hypothetical protein [bacterium]